VDRSDSDGPVRAWLWLLALGLMFCALSIGLAPGVNEAHYLAKARHFWQPDWCPRDIFLASSHVHLVFYTLFGWSTCWLPLSWVAYLGRAFCCFHLAWAWRRLSLTVVPHEWLSVLTAALAMVGITYGNAAGEWILGGVEAKSFAFPWVVLGLAALAAGDWRRVWLWLGLATAWHPLVGGWAWVSALFAWLTTPQPFRHRMQHATWMALGAACAIPGFVGVVGLNMEMPPELRTRAAEIYVYERLEHHLLPTSFGVAAWTRFATLVALWGIVSWRVVVPASLQRLQRVVVGSLLIGGAGVLIYAATFHDERLCARWMKYYWFRWSDVAVPWGLALALAYRLFGAAGRSPRTSIGRAVVVIAAVVGVGAIVLARWTWIPEGDLQGVRSLFRDREWQYATYAQWKETCQWIHHNTAPDALVLTPRCQQSLHWYAERSEVVNRKNIPQDPRGILEWWSRIQLVQSPFAVPLDEPATRAALTALAREFSADYAIVLNRDRLGMLSEPAISPTFVGSQQVTSPPDSPEGAPGESRIEVCFHNEIFVVIRWTTGTAGPVVDLPTGGAAQRGGP